MSTNRKTYITLKNSFDATFVNTKFAGGDKFVGSFYGMYATSSGKPSSNKAYFDWFEYVGNDSL